VKQAASQSLSDTSKTSACFPDDLVIWVDPGCVSYSTAYVKDGEMVKNPKNLGRHTRFIFSFFIYRPKTQTIFRGDKMNTWEGRLNASSDNRSLKGSVEFFESHVPVY
jgi:hypothetical protein